MESTQKNSTLTAPGYTLLLPVAYLLHLLEEWFGGFSNWTHEVLGQEISIQRFILINSIFLIITVAGSIASVRNARMTWIAIALCALFGLNGLLHLLATVGFAQYAPGVVTGTLIYIPLSLVLLKEMKGRTSSQVFLGSVLVGIILHGLIFWMARI